MSFEFLTVERDGSGPAAESPFARLQEAAGARFEIRDGWRTATGYGAARAELEACRSRVGIADRSQLGKLELQARASVLAEIAREVGDGAELALGRVRAAGGARWCRFTPERALVLASPGDTAALRERLEAAARDRFASVIDLTAGLAALAVVGPAARELLARLTAIDLRPAWLPQWSLRPGSIARVPGTVLREQGDRFLLLFDAYQAQYMWTAVSDAGERFGAMAVGADALERLGSDAPAPVAASEARADA